MLFRYITFFIFLTTSVSAQNLDIDMLKNINQNRNTSLDKPLYNFDKTVYPLSFATAVGCYGIGVLKHDKHIRRKGFDMMASLAVSLGTTYVLKKQFERERPYVTYPFIQNYYLEDDYSMPSGHTTAAFSMATSLSLAYPKWYVIVPSFAYAGVVGYSRLHLGVHYPSDVLLGAAIGSGSAWVTYKANKWIRKKTRVIRAVRKL